MPIYLNSKPGTRLPKGKRRGAPVRAPRRIAASVRHAIAKSMEPLIQEMEGLAEWLNGTATPSQAARVMREMQDRWRQAYGPQAQRLAGQWVEEINREGKKNLEKSVARALGIDMTTVFDDATVRDAAELMSIEARSLITSVQDDYLAAVQTAVTHSYQQLPLPEGRSLAEHIQNLAGVSDRQARLIARDQTSKINTAINQARQTAIGIEEYIWRTARDARVVGTPGGAFPKGNAVHGNHHARQGLTYRWDTPPHDGHPGYAINCRCWAYPIIDVDTLRNAA